MSVKYEKLIQEDFNVGTSRVWIVAPGGGQARATQVGIHTPAVGQQKWTKTWAPGAISAGGYATTDVTVPDAAVGSLCMASHDKMLTNDLDIWVHISAASTATVIIHNPTSAAITVPSGTVAVVVFEAIDTSLVTTPPPVAGFTWEIISPYVTVQFTDTSTGDITSWLWDFGDPGGAGSDPSTQNPGWIYSGYGDFTVRLTVTGPGGSDWIEDTVTTVGP